MKKYTLKIATMGMLGGALALGGCTAAKQATASKQAVETIGGEKISYVQDLGQTGAKTTFNPGNHRFDLIFEDGQTLHIMDELYDWNAYNPAIPAHAKKYTVVSDKSGKNAYGIVCMKNGVIQRFANDEEAAKYVELQISKGAIVVKDNKLVVVGNLRTAKLIKEKTK